MIVLSMHTQSMNDLKERLTHIGVNYTERRFRRDEGIDGKFLVSSQMHKGHLMHVKKFHKLLRMCGRERA